MAVNGYHPVRPQRASLSPSRHDFVGKPWGAPHIPDGDGGDHTVDYETARADRARRRVLYLVVLAVVIMPVLAMTFKVDPKTFAGYIAPLGGLAGTVVGYWFGSNK